MAYSTFTAPAATGFSFTGFGTALGRGIAGFFGSLGRALTAASTGQARLEEAARLQAKTDAELAQIGLKREDIMHHVFREYFFL